MRQLLNLKMLNVTTQWLSVLMLPLLPTASYRVKEARHLPKGTYKACEKVPLSLVFLIWRRTATL